MYNIIKRKDLEPYASGLRWYKMTMTYDGADTAIKSKDFDFVEGQSGAQLPAEITGPALINNYDLPAILNFVAVDVMIIPTVESVLDAENANFAPGYANVGTIDGSTKSDIQINPSLQYSYTEVDIYVLGYPLNDAVYDTGNL